MRFLTLIFLPFIFLTACGGGGGGSLITSSNDINNVPTCSDTGTSYQTTEYNYMAAGYSNNGLRTVCASTAYANGATGGTGVKIGVNDTGIMLQSDGDMGHQEFGSVGSTNSRIVLG